LYKDINKKKECNLPKELSVDIILKKKKTENENKEIIGI
jgi:hypothetical protein